MLVAEHDYRMPCFSPAHSPFTRIFNTKHIKSPTTSLLETNSPQSSQFLKTPIISSKPVIPKHFSIHSLLHHSHPLHVTQSPLQYFPQKWYHIKAHLSTKEKMTKNAIPEYPHIAPAQQSYSHRKFKPIIKCLCVAEFENR